MSKKNLYDSARILERFLKYVKIESTSDSAAADRGKIPSTQSQWNMAKILKADLENLGLREVCITDECYVYGFLPPNFSTENSVCLISHMDTSEEVSGKNVNPVLTQKNGDTIISTDGKTLLGADDKAGLAEIISCMEFFVQNPAEKHTGIEVIFSPDEETGHGMDFVPLKFLKSKFAYTVDGGNSGELETECFNAFRSDVTFFGNSTHTGTARTSMVNAVRMMSSFVANLPAHEFPETTDGRLGFFAPVSAEGTIEKSSVSLLLRDFSEDGMNEKKRKVENLAKTVAEIFGGRAEVTHKFQYANMKKNLDKNPQVVERLVNAYKSCGIQPEFTPIRGGTDGSRLTEMGIPCPNIFTGGHEFHSKNEWASLHEMTKAFEILVELCREK